MSPTGSCGVAGRSRPEATCPVCGGPNACQMCTDEPYKGSCWCFRVEMPESLLKRVPAGTGEGRCVCHGCVADARRKERWMPRARAGECTFLEDGRMVFTAQYHLRRGYCCGNGCRNCPYDASGRPRADVLEALADGGGA